MMLRLSVFLFVVTLAASAPAAESGASKTREYINVPGHFDELPFTDAVLAGDTLYVSGRIGLDPKTRKVPAKLEDEVRLLMDAVKSAVERAGMTMDDIVQVTVFCPDLSLYDRFNAVYRAYFKPGRYPARAFIGSGKLLFHGHFEVTAIAVRAPAGKK